MFGYHEKSKEKKNLPHVWFLENLKENVKKRK